MGKNGRFSIVLFFIFLIITRSGKLAAFEQSEVLVGAWSSTQKTVVFLRNGKAAKVRVGEIIPGTEYILTEINRDGIKLLIDRNIGEYLRIIPDKTGAGFSYQRLRAVPVLN
jgi:hypothetical protein